MYIPEASSNTQPAANDSTTSQTQQAGCVSMLEDAFKVFVLTRKNRADIFHLDHIQQTYDCSAQLNTADIKQGHLVIEDHKAAILAASFSPDGSAIATSSADGEVKFFKITFGNSPDLNDDDDTAGDRTVNFRANDELVNEVENSGRPKQQRMSAPPAPKCLRQWWLHDNKPVTSIYFLDDHKNPSADEQFWSFILTGTDYNREIKIWCSIKWECLQTIRFMPAPVKLADINLANSSSSILPGMKVNATKNVMLPMMKTAIDITSTYLVSEKIFRRC